MSITEADQTTKTSSAAPDASLEPKVETEQTDFLLPSLFVSAAALILAFQDPINISFQPRVLETLAIVVMGIALVGVGTLRRKLPLLFLGTGVLFISIGAGVITQPAQFNLPFVAIWPLRLALALLVACAWAFLMGPRSWLRRALVAFVIPTALALAVWGGPATATQLFPEFAAQVFGQVQNMSFANFAPYWLAVDTHDNLYATDNDGGIIWVFDSSGNAKGTLQPARAPSIPTPGPGILPSGYEAELNLPGAGLSSTPTPVGGTLAPKFQFCGLATDNQDNVYMVDLTDPQKYTLLRFDRDGNITARWPVPKGYEPTNGCVAADADHVYLSARTGSIYVLDLDGKLQREVKVGYQPFGISTAGKEKLLVMGPTQLKRIEADTGQVVTMTMPPPSEGLQIPMLALRNGQLLTSDHVESRIARVNPENGAILGKIGGKGTWPGQFGAIGGMAEDQEGRIYVADYGNRVIQRFTPNGKIDAVLWAKQLSSEQGETER